MSRQLILSFRRADHCWSVLRKGSRTINGDRSTVPAILSRHFKMWHSTLPGLGCNNGSAHIHSPHHITASWAIDWTQLLQIPARVKAKSKSRRRWKPPPNWGEEILFWIFMVFFSCLQDYYFTFFFNYQVITTEKHSDSISISTIRIKRTQGPIERSIGLPHPWEVRAFRWQCSSKEGIWTLQISDTLKWFPRLRPFGVNLSRYTPLPPIEVQEPGDLRVLVHREEDDNRQKYAVNEKVSKTGSFIRMSQLRCCGQIAPLPKDVERVVVFASGVTGIAPMLHSIHTLLNVRRGDGLKGQIIRPPDIHVVWFKESSDPVHENGVFRYGKSSSEPSAADELGSSELEQLRLRYPQQLTVESVNVGDTLTQGTNIIESAPGPTPTWLQRLNTWGYLPESHRTVNSSKMLLISGPESLSKRLSGNEGQSYTEDGPSIVARAKKCGWRIMDLSKMKVCN